METEFTPFISLVGGMLIGLSAVIFMASIGKTAGISGIVARFLTITQLKEFSSNYKVSLAFIIGLLLAAPAYFYVAGDLPQQSVSSNVYLLVGAGLLVGFGSALGSGCTSGHGVCGISRGSKRSIAATLTFMITAFITVYISRHVIGA
ncbi:MAG: hypothetical protein COC17_03345 [Hyphomicrobiales bacterium]|nr:YeeE/YedE family protein [Hyphomicrobiales bacterium]PCH50947.1 MAG: hypothetical protein COC17_03345 [Hyphomicrobiales bacterium]